MADRDRAVAIVSIASMTLISWSCSVETAPFSAPGLANRPCPPPSYVTGFDANGEPICQARTPADSLIPDRG